jgi:hypothetical protein
VLSTFLGLTRGGARRYGLVGARVDAGGEVDKVAGWENENGAHVGVEGAYQGIVDCAVGHRDA